MYDNGTATVHFSELLKCKTVNNEKEEFIKIRELLKEFYPELHKKCEYRLIDNDGIVYRWKGKTSFDSVILMAHYDVVPAPESGWHHPPFSGTIADGKIWGRGAIDTKCTFCAILESVEALLSKGFIPSSDIYICFGGDEETNGNNAIHIANDLKRQGINPYLILDEGGAVVNGSVAGINKPCALIGIAEKGYMDVEFITASKGGHSSLATSKNPVSVMAEVIRRIDANIFKTVFNEPLELMVDAAQKNASLKYRLILKTYKLWFKIAPVKKLFLKVLPEINALTRTISSITQISGGNAENVIPEKVRAVGNFRIINGSSVEETLDKIKKVLSDLNVQINLISALEPSVISPTTGQGWGILTETIAETWEDSIPIPYLMLARSDSRSYSAISDDIYRFSPIMLTKEERVSIHGVNEGIKIEDFFGIIEFYTRLISKI